MIDIQLIERSGLPWSHPSPVRFGPAGGAIGRGADCHLLLDDPDRRISRRQAAVVYRDGRYFLRQLRQTCPVEIHGRLLMAEEEAELAPDDEIRIGPYMLRVVAIDPDSLEGEASRAPIAAVVPGLDPLQLFVSDRAAAGGNPLRRLLDPTPPVAGSSAGSERSVDLAVGEPTGIGARPNEWLEAFLDGAGVSNLPANVRTPQLMHLVGVLLRESMQGTLDLLAARTIEKREFRADATLLKTRENNPLKFSPNVETALAHLLNGAVPGFMPPEEAVRDAVGDLRAHQIAVLAGIRGAINAMLERLDPAQLEARLSNRGGWNALLPGARKAQLWDRYVETHSAIRREAEDTDAAFGKAFREAYAAQMAKLKG